MTPEHKHEFAVDAACDCGLMISDIMRDLQEKWSGAEDEITRLIAQYDEQNVYIEKLKVEIAALKRGKGE